MPFKLGFKFPPGEWIVATTEAEKIIARALTKSMRDVAKDGRDRARATIASAGFGKRSSNSIRFKMFPANRDVLNPEAYIHSTLNYLDIFERGGVISGKPYLWIPLPSVPKIRGRAHMTPRQYVKNIGPLVTIKRAGKPPMLGAVVSGPARAQPFGTFVTRGRLKRGATGRGSRRIVPLFVAVTSVTIPKKFDVTSQIEKAAEKLPQLYNSNEDKKPI